MTIYRGNACPALFHSETKWYTMKYWSIVWKYVFLLHVLNKNENIINAILNKNENIINAGAGYFLKIAKISSHKTQEIANLQK